MKRKSLYALIMVIAISVTMLTGCIGRDMHTSEDGTPMLALLEDSVKEVAFVDGEAITVADLQYYIYHTAMMQIYQNDPDFSGDIAKVKWDEKLKSGKTLEETILDEAMRTAIADLATVRQSVAVEIRFTEEEKAQVKELISSFVTENGEEQFKLNMQAMGIDSQEEYEKIYERVMIVQKMQEDVRDNIGNYVPTVEVLKPYKNKDKASVQHVLILSQDSKHENPEAVAKEVHEKAKSGVPFSELIYEYNEDPGASVSGYTFGPGEMVPEFEKASFALEFNEISDIVETEYGYHIIRRIVDITEAQNYWVAESDVKIKEGILRKISVPDVVNAVVDAQKVLQEQNMSQTEEKTEGENQNG